MENQIESIPEIEGLQGKLSAPAVAIPESVLAKFPPFPPYTGTWHPVYWTPMRGSGERLTALVVARGCDGACCIRRTIRSDALSVLYGDHAPVLNGWMNLVEQSLTDHLARDESLSAWLAPVTGFVIGQGRPGYAQNIRQIAAQGVCTEASLADPALADLNQA